MLVANADPDMLKIKNDVKVMCIFFNIRKFYMCELVDSQWYLQCIVLWFILIIS